MMRTPTFAQDVGELYQNTEEPNPTEIVIFGTLTMANRYTS